jgi:16S rRNA (guanine1516-N2)-methyltransferase
MNAPSICIVCTDPVRKKQADKVAKITGLPLLNEQSDEFELQLRFDDNRVSLFDTALNTSIHVDFAEGTLAHRQQFGGGRGQAIARAVGLKHGNTPGILDITAGLARDAYILANLGCKITLVEQSAVLYTLVEDGIQRGLANSASAEVLKNFVNLVNADSVAYMQEINRDNRPDVVYMDPMYPERTKSALVKKDMQILQHLLAKEENTEQLLKAALKCAGKRVVVKRPIHADTPGNIKPDTSISSKKTRFDVYIVNRREGCAVRTVKRNQK